MVVRFLVLLDSFLEFFLNLFPGYRQEKSLERWCETSKEIRDWLDANTIPISWSETGRSLVRGHIKNYLEFLKHHRWIEADINYIEFWISCLKPSPYTPPPVSRRSPHPVVGFFFF